MTFLKVLIQMPVVHVAFLTYGAETTEFAFVKPDMPIVVVLARQDLATDRTTKAGPSLPTHHKPVNRTKYTC